MSFMIWPFTDRVGTWKDSTGFSQPYVKNDCFVVETSDYNDEVLPTLRLVDDQGEALPYLYIVSRLSSNVNSRINGGSILPKRKPVGLKVGKIQLPPGRPMQRVVRRWDSTTNKVTNVEIPLLTYPLVKYNIKEAAKSRFSAKANALWFRETTFQVPATDNRNVIFYQDMPDREEILDEDGVTILRPFIEAHRIERFNVFGDISVNDSLFDPVGILPSLMFDPAQYGAPNIDLMSEYSEIIDGLTKRSATKMRSAVLNQKLDLATDLAEGAQTVRLIADMAVRIAKTFLEIKKLRVVSAAKALLPTSRKQLANDFLAYRYGLAPLISDIQGAAESFAATIVDSTRCRAKGSSTKEVETEEFFPIFDNNDQAVIRVVRKRTTVTVRHKCSMVINDEAVKKLGELGFTNPANVIWELVPFSFVVDWFLPIGNFLKLIGTYDQLTITECTRTIFIKQLVHLSTRIPEGLQFNGLITGPEVECAWNLENVECIREVIPAPENVLPSFKNPFSVGHGANALALFLQLLK
jgi:hypothetical protein